MASTRGPLPARNAARGAAKRGKAAQADEVESFSRYPVPSAKPEWEAETVAWYESLDQSGQARFYEPTDWQHALLIGDMLDEFYSHEVNSRPSAEKMKALFSEMDKLGVTESSRRRMRIEVKRPGQTNAETSPAAEKATALDEFRELAESGA